MAELFKDVYSIHSITKLADHLGACYSDFEHQAFVALATEKLEQHEMKQRANQIIRACEAYLPSEFERTADILLACLSSHNEEDGWNTKDANYVSGVEGWLIAPLADYVGMHGQQHFEISMNLLKEFTKRFSSEFGLRYFLTHQTQKTLAHLRTWIDDPDQHVRRLISEGTRPRLPWGMQLKAFMQDPQPIIDLISLLKDDDQEYVRRSVANNLNDIAKDHPDIVANIAKDWLKGANKNRQRLVKHACRTLLKQGHLGVLDAFGFGPPQFSHVILNTDQNHIMMGESLGFELSVQISGEQEQHWMIDYVIHHKKAKGHTSPKVFKWKQVDVVSQQNLTINKKHPFKPITTRVYYSGEHAVEILINGVSVAKKVFTLSA